MDDNRRPDVSRVREAVASLPALPRAVFRLHAAERLDYPTIAERLGVSIPEVEQALAEALGQLMHALEPP